MRAVVTGGAGHLGEALVRRLVSEKYDVTVLTYDQFDEEALEGLNVQKVRCDILDPPQLQKAFQGADYVFHLAARISIDGDPDGKVFQTNVIGTQNVMEAALAANIQRVIHLSSVHVYDLKAAKGTVIREDSPRIDTQDTNCSAYDRSKALAEDKVLQAVQRGLDAVILNPSGCMGPYDYRLSRMGQTLLSLYEGTMPVLLEGGFDWVDTRDVADAMLKALEHGRKGEKYLITGHYASVRELADIAQSITMVTAPSLTMGARIAKWFAPLAVAWARLMGSEPLYTAEAVDTLTTEPLFSRDKATRELGYAPRPLLQTISDTYDDFGDRGMLYSPGSPFVIASWFTNPWPYGKQSEQGN